MSEVLQFAKGDFLTEDEAMSLAIQEGKRGAGFVRPNPEVGCVILDKEGRFLASGYHKKWGGPHAEIEALKKVTPAELVDAQVFVTLEPCAHEGKTPSCAKHLTTLPIHSVTYGLEDPNPSVSGKGAAILRSAGIKVSLYTQLQSELEELCEIFLHNMRTQSPFISIKVASSLDGQLALKNGESKWLTGESAREHVHYLRATHEAVLVGHATLTIDNPSLNIRHPHFPEHINRVVILDPYGKCLPQLLQLQVALCHKPENLFVVTSESAMTPTSPFATVLKVKYIQEKGFDLNHLYQTLWDQKIRSVLIEGGAYTISQILEQKQFQRLYLFIAPHILGAQGSLSWTSQFSIAQMKDRLTLDQMRIQKFRQDVLLTGLLTHR